MYNRRMNIKEAKKNIEIIKETKDFLLVYKPAGLAVESRSLKEADLEHILRSFGKKREYLAVINRLDQPVEGLVLFAQSRKAAALLSKQMTEHKMQKEYMALVEGVPEKTERELMDFLVKNGRENRSFVAKEGSEGAKKARLFYHCVKIEKGKSLLRIKLYSGRHHQIRVQLSHAGLPIIGDQKYGYSDTQEYAMPALCSCAIGFFDPSSGEKLFFEHMPKGKAFRDFLEKQEDK